MFPLRLIGYALSELPHSLAGWRRVREVLDEPIEPTRWPRSWPPDGLGVQLDDVGFTFAGDVAAGARRRRPRRRRAGRIVAVVGPTGAGKSTLVELVAGLVAADVRHRAPTPGARAIVFQEAFLFSGTIRHNLALGDEFGDDDLWEALRLARPTTSWPRRRTGSTRSSASAA